MNNKIKIVTGKIHTGKTTKLFTFLNSKNSVDGILAPIVNERRRLYHLSSKTIKELEVDENKKGTITVGKYFFLEDSFNWANKKLVESFSKSPDWLVIDEIGKLELQRKGLHSSVNEILTNRSKSNTNIILVIRDYLLDDALDYYRIGKDDYEILDL